MPEEIIVECPTCGNVITIHKTVGKGFWPAIIKCNKCGATFHRKTICS